MVYVASSPSQVCKTDTRPLPLAAGWGFMLGTTTMTPNVAQPEARGLEVRKFSLDSIHLHVMQDLRTNCNTNNISCHKSHINTSQQRGALALLTLISLMLYTTRTELAMIIKEPSQAPKIIKLTRAPQYAESVMMMSRRLPLAVRVPEEYRKV